MPLRPTPKIASSRSRGPKIGVSAPCGEHRRLAVDRLQALVMRIQPPRIGRADQRRVDRMHVAHAAPGPLEDQPAHLVELAGPAALRLVGDHVHPPRYIGRSFGPLLRLPISSASSAPAIAACSTTLRS
jgi:hypothetical protein